MKRDFSNSTRQALIDFLSNRENLYNDDVSEENLMDCQDADNMDYDMFAEEIEAYIKSANDGLIFADLQLLGLIGKINYVFYTAQQLDIEYAQKVELDATTTLEVFLTGLQSMVDAISLEKLGNTEAEILCSIGKHPTSGIFGDSDYCSSTLKDVNKPYPMYGCYITSGLPDIKDTEKRIEELANSKENILDLSDTEKQELIMLYESLHEEYGHNLNKCLSLMYYGYGDYEKDADNIKVISYTAPEPYRTIFLENIGEIRVLDTEFAGIDNYSSKEAGLYLNVNSWNGNYNTFFHECGHAIDDLLVEDGELSTTYSKNGVYLTDVLESDVRNVVTASVDEKMEEQEIPEADRPKMREEIVEGIMNCCDKNYDKPIFYDNTAKVYDLVIDDVKSGNAKASSDIYGAYTGNLLQGTTGHSALRKNKDDYYYYSYWTEGEYNEKTHEYTIKYSEDGTIKYSKMIPVEFFAHNFAAQMTRDPGELDGIYGLAKEDGNRNERFRESIPFMDKMIQDAYENMN